MNRYHKDETQRSNPSNIYLFYAACKCFESAEINHFVEWYEKLNKFPLLRASIGDITRIFQVKIKKVYHFQFGCSFSLYLSSYLFLLAFAKYVVD